MVYLKPQCIQDMDSKVEDEQLRTNIHSFLYMQDLIPNYQNRGSEFNRVGEGAPITQAMARPEVIFFMCPGKQLLKLMAES